jgi:hypothetical protein
MLAAAAPSAPPSIAVDPANDRALATWLAPEGGPRIEYSVNGPTAGRASRRPSGGAPVGHTDVDWLPVAGAVALVAVLAAVATRRRRQVRGG